MALDTDQTTLIKMIGHDGSKIQWPTLEEPYCRQAFHPQELIDCAMRLEHLVMQIEFCPESLPGYGNAETCKPMLPEYQRNRFNYYLNTFANGVIIGYTASGKPHAVAWDGLKLNDPNGQIYSINKFNPAIFFVVISVK